ncbi:MAG: polyphosphate polymerase domain-containing protein [Pseudomonadales bacterium]
MIAEHPAGLLQTLPPVIERHELKYMVPHHLIEPISVFLEPYCALDSHSQAQSDGFYSVNSLYFDTPGLRFLKQRMGGVDRRFNMRMRAYADGSEGPYFAEVKYKTPTSVKKFRSTFNSAVWPDEMAARCPRDRALTEFVSADKEAISRELFLRLATAYAIEPKIFTCYRRRAFFSRLDDYARVTFDIDMRFRAQEYLYCAEPFSLRPDANCQNYDAQTIYADEAIDSANVVLELKAEIGSIPVWMLELIRRFELKQVGFSKYMQSSLAHHWDNGFDYMNRDRCEAALASARY